MNDRLIDLVKRLLASQGRDGDTMLAHINPREAAMLKAAGGSGTTNPKTGLPEFSDGLGGGFGGSATGAPGVDPRGESTAGAGGSVGNATSLSGPAVSDLQAAISANAPTGSGFSLNNALTLAQAAIAPSLSPASMATGMAQNIFSGTPPQDLTQEQIMSMAPMGSLATAIGKGVVGLGTMLGLENQGNAPATEAPGANDIGSFQPTYMETSSPQTTPADYTPTPQGQALASQGFYSTPSLDAVLKGLYTTPSTVAPTSAIDPVLQSAMLYARG